MFTGSPAYAAVRIDAQPVVADRGAVDLAGDALGLFRPERRQEQRAHRPFIHQRVAAYRMSLWLIIGGGLVMTAVDCALYALYLYFR